MGSLASWWAGLHEGSAEFLITPSETLKRSDLIGLLERFAAAFAVAGLNDGDRVLILLPDETAATVAYIAAMLDGLVPVMLAPDTPAPRAAAIAATVRPAVLMALAERAQEAWAQALPARMVFGPGSAQRRWFGGAPKPVNRLAQGFGLPERGQPPRLPADPDGLAYVIFTSGTTSQPKGVMVRRRSLFANLDTIAQVLSVACRSRLFNDMVLAHADGMVQGPLLALSTGATLIRAGGFGVDRMEAWLDTVRREGATHFTTVPTVWALIDRYAQHADYFATPGFKALSSVAAHLDAELWARTEQRFGHPLTNQYGLTETVASALFAGPHPQAGERFGVGLPVGGAARIEALAAGDAVGELQLQGDHLFAGYWGDEEATAQAFTSDGWLRTGDLARQDERGQFHIVGRLKRIINSGGFLIRPEELDEAMLRHPAVLGAATLAWPDELFGEVPVTAIVLADASVDETALTAHARASLEPKKVPKRIVVIDDMPRGDAGKPRLDRVRELVAERVQAGEVMAGTQAAAERLDHALIETAARVFRVDAATLSLRSSPETVDSWDSFQQIALIVALESRFGVRIPAGRAASIRSLASALEAIEMARRS